MAAHGLTAPQPLPANRDAWSAFVRVRYYRHPTMGGEGFPNWSDISGVLSLYGQWHIENHVKLTVCFNELMTLEAEQRKAENG